MSAPPTANNATSTAAFRLTMALRRLRVRGRRLHGGCQMQGRELERGLRCFSECQSFLPSQRVLLLCLPEGCFEICHAEFDGRLELAGGFLPRSCLRRPQGGDMAPWRRRWGPGRRPCGNSFSGPWRWECRSLSGDSLRRVTPAGQRFWAFGVCRPRGPPFREREAFHVPECVTISV